MRNDTAWMPTSPVWPRDTLMSGPAAQRSSIPAIAVRPGQERPKGYPLNSRSGLVRLLARRGPAVRPEKIPENPRAEMSPSNEVPLKVPLNLNVRASLKFGVNSLRASSPGRNGQRQPALLNRR